jgi:hypothetical protein
MAITVSALLALARTVEDKQIITLANRRAFRVKVLNGDSGLQFTPTSSGVPRRSPAAKIREVLAHYEKTESLRLADYHDITFNSSYVLALIKHFIDQNVSGTPLSAEKVELEYAEKLREAKKLSGPDLQDRLQNSSPDAQKISVVTTAFVRNPYVATAVLKRANGKCEACGKPAPFLRAKDGEPYLEVHHIVQLAKGGKDTVKNAQALCPNCHRRAHYG